jgi:hypothetical protein
VKTERAAGFVIKRKPRNLDPGYRLASVGPPFPLCENGTSATFRGPIRINVCVHRFQDVKTDLAAGFGVGINRQPRNLDPGYRIACVGPPFSRCEHEPSGSLRGPKRINVYGSRFQYVKMARAAGSGVGINRQPRNVDPVYRIAAVGPPFSRCENGTSASFRGPIRLNVCGRRFHDVKTERSGGFDVGVSRRSVNSDPVIRIAPVFKMWKREASVSSRRPIRVNVSGNRVQDVKCDGPSSRVCCWNQSKTA